MATIVTFLGKPVRGQLFDLAAIDGMESWHVGDARLFDDALATRFGFASGDDFALFYVDVMNNPTKLFELAPAPSQAGVGVSVDTQAGVGVNAETQNAEPAVPAETETDESANARTSTRSKAAAAEEK